ncbi:MAG: response regulator [Candidatus Krumholzibacteria bacterium]|jgi:DNA-binding NtrC family response regulator|nr:response regulator [Candidatus Krumholzibacteria bacterium]
MTAGALVRRRVLIADDDDDFRRDLSAMLGQYFEIFTVARGEAVVECVRSEGVEVVLLDIDFGEEPSGLAVLEMVQGLEEPPRTIMLTAENRVEIGRTRNPRRRDRLCLQTAQPGRTDP